MKKIILFIMLVFILPMSLALDFDVNCDAATAGNNFNCRISLNQNTDSSTQLAGLSFTVEPAEKVKSVTFTSPLTPTSIPPRYGFADFSGANPFTGSGTLATITLQTSQNFNLDITPLSATLGDRTDVSINNINFEQVKINLGGTPTLAALGEGCKDNDECESNTCDTTTERCVCSSNQENIAGYCKTIAQTDGLASNVAGILTNNGTYKTLLQKISAIATALRNFFS